MLCAPWPRRRMAAKSPIPKRVTPPAMAMFRPVKTPAREACGVPVPLDCAIAPLVLPADGVFQPGQPAFFCVVVSVPGGPLPQVTIDALWTDAVALSD